MTGNVEYHTTFTFRLLTAILFIYQTQGQARTCSLLSRPHPNGYCGEKLAQLHRNYCFLIRQRYPQLFPMVKRSVSKATESNNNPYVEGGLKNKTSPSHQDYQQDPQEHLPKSQSRSAFIDLLVTRHSRSKRSLVCECCYGPCAPNVLARYC